ncbi:MAG: hypothetical protein PW788_00480 [Micavibrio sp.]|nr:hypothetical protein [Micavibrio sp.]
MKNFFLPGFIVLCIIFFAFVAFAADVVREEDTQYLAAVKAAQETPAEDAGKIDWANLRQLYFDTTFYEEHLGVVEVPNLYALGKEASTGMDPTDIAMFRLMMQRHAANIGAHQIAYRIYKESHPSFIDSAKEILAMRGLMNAIVKTGDGKSPATAFVAFTRGEEYAVVQGYLNLKIVEIKPQDGDRKTYDVFDAFNDNGDAFKVYFDVTRRTRRKNEVAKALQAEQAKEEPKAATDKPAAAHP